MKDHSTIATLPSARHVAWQVAADRLVSFRHVPVKTWISLFLVSSGWLLFFNILDVILRHEVPVSRWFACLFLPLCLPFSIWLITYFMFRLAPSLVLDDSGLRLGYWGRP